MIERAVLAASVLLLLCGSARAADTDLLQQARVRRAQAESELERLTAELAQVRREGLERIEAARKRRAEADAARTRAQTRLEALKSRQQLSVEERTRRLDRRRRRLWVATSTGGAMPESQGGYGRSVLDSVEERLSALRADAAFSRETRSVMGRDGRVARVPVVRLGASMALAGGETEDGLGFLVPPADDGGLMRVSGVRLPPDLAAAARAVASGSGRNLPLDVDGSLARTDAPLARTFVDRMKAGGFFVWPILAVGLLGLVLAAERVRFFWSDREPGFGRVLDDLRQGRFSAVSRWASDGTTSLRRVAQAGIDARADEREGALETALLREEPAVQRGLGIIAACAGIAPLLGLLGTVTGMIATFDVITVHGTGNPRLLSGGISVALVTTQVGLVVAVPLLLVHAILSRAAQKKGGDLEQVRSALIEASEEPEASA